MKFAFLRCLVARKRARCVRFLALAVLLMLFVMAGLQELLVRIDPTVVWTFTSQYYNVKKNTTLVLLPMPAPHTAILPPKTFYEILGDNYTLPLKMPTELKNPGEPKYILSYDGQFSQANLNGCPDLNCKMLVGSGNIEKANAVVLSGGNENFFPNRKMDQYFVFMTQESPLHFHVSSSLNYNLTMGYRRDADLPCPYGYSIVRNEPLENYQLSPELLKTKTKSVAWFVSNCHSSSGRERYAEALGKHINVDIYGACGKLKCPKSEECERKLRENYRFYLAFENSVCKDYISEKLWSQGFSDILPIVLKRSLIENYVPPKSFLAVDDFKNAKEMADYLGYLQRNDSAYLEFFQWRRDYEVIFLDGKNHDLKERPWGFCRLCEYLWRKERIVQSYQDIVHWWTTEAKCDKDYVKKFL